MIIVLQKFTMDPFQSHSEKQFLFSPAWDIESQIKETSVNWSVREIIIFRMTKWGTAFTAYYLLQLAILRKDDWKKIK